MPSALQAMAGYIMFPLLAMIIGGTIAAFRPPSPTLQSYFQHFAAGVVFAAAAGEVLPEIQREHDPLPLILGFSIGVLTMLGIKYVTGRMEQAGHGEQQSATRLLLVVGIDLLTDGLLLGVGFTVGAKAGLLLTIALTLEILFLGLSTATELIESGSSRQRTILTMLGLGSMVLVGAIVGITLLQGLSGAPLTAVLSFGAAALLYLVTEELLVEAHKVEDTPLRTGAFFVGFLILFVIETLA